MVSLAVPVNDGLVSLEGEAGWSTVTATYFAFRDDVLTRLLARQAQMQFAYEDRIADLRGQVDRLAGRQLLDQEQFEGKLDAMARRQAVLESRSAALATLPDTAPTGSIKGASRGAIAAPAISACSVMIRWNSKSVAA